MRRMVTILAVLAVTLSGCSRIQRGEGKLPQVSTDCGAASCVHVMPMTDGDGAPISGATVLIPFNQPVKLGASQEVAVVNAVMNLETREPQVTFAGVKAMRVDRKTPKQLVIEVDSFLADGSGIAFGAGVLTSKKGTPLPPLELKLTTPWSPLTAALANIVWDPTDKSLFSHDGTRGARGTTAEAAVRQELEARLRLRNVFTDEQIAGVLAQFDSDSAKKKIPHARVRAGLLTLWGTSAEYAIEFILADTNRRGVPFEPIAIEDLDGAGAAVFYHPLEGKLRMYVDRDVAQDSLEGIGVVLAHEAVHSDLGGGSVAEEVLAMASDTRVYQEFLIWDPALALAPTTFTRAANIYLLALLNSGRFGFPRPGLLPRPGVDDALRGTAKEPARSFQDLLAKPHVYGDYNPKAGDVATEVIEAYYRRISGNNADSGRLKYDRATLKLFDAVIESGLSDEQLFKVVDALRLKPVPLR